MSGLLTRMFRNGSPSAPNFILAGLMTLCLIPVGCENDNNNGSDRNVVVLEAGDDLETRAQSALIEATPGTIIELPAGTYDFMGELSVSVPNITLRGQGMEETVLDFANQQTGGQGILGTGDYLTVEDLSVVETPGDGIKIKGTNGVTIRRVRVGWESHADENNGAYGLYPVRTTNVLIEDSEVYGASDAGIYVGQSRNIIVRRNYVHENVAGIEIENSTVADVYENETTENTAGILVFDLPDLEIRGGERTRVFNNEIYNNNTKNFAPPGNIVGSVPTGTGIIVMASDDIEVFDNTISDHSTVGIAVVGYYASRRRVDDPEYDPVPEKIYIHNNTFRNNATEPRDSIGAAIADVFTRNNASMPTFYYDSSGVEGARLPEDRRICARENGDITAGTFDILVASSGGAGDLEYAFGLDFFDCAHPPLPEVILDEPDDVDVGHVGHPHDEDAIAQLCETKGEGINAEAFRVNCPNLSDYRLFVDRENPAGDSNGGIKYDLTTPLFTDYAVKYREAFVPEGMQASYHSTDTFDFPVGTIIAKTFFIKSDLRDSSSAEASVEASVKELIETRLLIHREDGWVGLPYVWNADKSDAALTLAGDTQAVSWIDAAGISRTTSYGIPNANQCKNCHGEAQPKPIGPKARLLNKDFDYAGGTANQIAHWTAEGILTGARAVHTIDTIPAWDDTAADLEDRAKGYLDINCAHCHNPEGAGNTSALYLEYTRGLTTEYGLCKPPVAAGNATGGLEHDIYPGDASLSIVVRRMDSNEANVKMPELGRSIIHTQGVALITEWIDNLTPVGCP
uniref:Parallel beta-helix repeat-containing protein n=1 Tax=Candidatus Kentrum sp. FM TaxID=2126340 RepID=A0A450TD91_9GAMM|nr:MAG: parallel beta-helix repeat-containing protein [Candidatus Kentron sp. FM]VFJ64918.1 MAG: parallel beta-helix repeat-containing protein [Candidatus Kentron sp. FM]VFK14080.1 MAG: parallel beta-helix repeat-containing protein [Candidatus Kentron sp. FM]